MKDINDLYVDLDLVLNKRTKLGNLLSPLEIDNIKKKVEKNHWDENLVLNYIYRYLKENISDLLDSSDFLDANVIVESDPYIAKAMELMAISQRHAEVLLVDKEYKYPGCWVNDISEALKGLECKTEDYNILVWDAYFMRNYSINSKIPGWAHLADVLESYYDTL